MAESKPNSELAARVLPAPLYEVLRHVFEQQLEGCILVGGTALAGYYAGHRRSDDLDLFVRDSGAHRATVLAVRSSADLGVKVEERQTSAQFYDAVCEYRNHGFTAQVALDARLFEIGRSQQAGDGVFVAELRTLLKQKAATLVSRCSEKDLYDLLWLFQKFPELALSDIVRLGAEVDSGVTPETVLYSLVGSTLRESACGFAAESAKQVYGKIRKLKEELARGFEKLAEKQEVGSIGDLVRALK